MNYIGCLMLVCCFIVPVVSLWFASFAAPTASEIADELPKEIVLTDGVFHGEFFPCFWYETCINEWSVNYSSEDSTLNDEAITNTSLVEALASLWQWCVEQGHIKTGVGL